ncbi:MAG: metallophosphoesterase [Candidatus Woesearchaeota archaeon]
MKLHEDIEIFGLGLFFEDTLILSDIHLGIEESLNKEGMFIPRYHYEDIVKETVELIEELRPERIIINGDLKHDLSSINKAEWKQIPKYLEILSKHAELIIIKGNHDIHLTSMLKNTDYKLVDSYVIKNKFVLHGHEIIDTDCDTIIIGHNHPAVTLSHDNRDEKFKCFLKGKYKDKTLIVMPSFSNLTEGTDILKDKQLSPYLTDLSEFEVFVAEADGMYFGKVKDLEKMMK